MKKLVLNILLLSIFFYGCETQSKFVLTGVRQPSLPENTEVKVVAWGDPGDYEAIGIADIGQYTLDRRIEEAKRIARQNGGDVIMPKGVKLQGGELIIGEDGYLIQSFLILRIKEEPEIAMVKDIKEDDGKGDKGDELEKSSLQRNYGNLPRATYKLLLNDYKSLKGELFKGSLYPKRYYKMPRKLRSHARGNKKFLMVSTRSGKYRLFLVVPGNMADRFKSIIRKGGKFNFVYSPIDVYETRRGKYPVLEYVDEIKE